MEERKAHRKVRTGTVVSNKMDKTIVVSIDHMAKHSLYGKPVLRSKKLMAHDEDNSCCLGDVVMIGETRPLSAKKRWEILEIIKKAPVLSANLEEEEA